MQQAASLLTASPEACSLSIPRRKELLNLCQAEMGDSSILSAADGHLSLLEHPAVTSIEALRHGFKSTLDELFIEDSKFDPLLMGILLDNFSPDVAQLCSSLTGSDTSVLLRGALQLACDHMQNSTATIPYSQFQSDLESAADAIHLSFLDSVKTHASTLGQAVLSEVFEAAAGLSPAVQLRVDELLESFKPQQEEDDAQQTETAATKFVARVCNSINVLPP